MQLRGDAGSRSAQVGAPSSETQVQESWVRAENGAADEVEADANDDDDASEMSAA